MAIYKRPGSKYYWFKFVFDGELVQRSSKCTSKIKAREVESAFRHELVLGRIGIKPRKKAPSFKQAAEDFLKWSKITHANKPNSYERIRYSCHPLIDFFGEKRVDRICIKDIENFVVKRSAQKSRKTGEPMTRDSINLELGALKAIFKRLASEKYLTDNPAKDLKRLAENERNFHVLTNEEEKIYLMACPQPLQDIAALMLETGMRPSEVYKLSRRNVFLEKDFLQIENSKTRSSNRRIWLSDKAADILRRRLEKFKGEYLFPAGDSDGEPPVAQLNKSHRETINRIGLDFRLYDCRHSFATRALESGVDLLTLASMLGHSDLNQVTRYAHPSEERKNEAVRQMQKRKTKAV